MRVRKASSWEASAACIVDSNWLSWASSAASLWSTNALDVLGVVGLVGLEQQQRSRAVRCERVLRVEVRIAGRDDGVAHEPAGVAVVRVQPVALPRVVAEDDLRLQFADDPGDHANRLAVARQLAVDVAEEAHLAGPAAGDAASGLTLLELPPGDQGGEVGAGVPRALRSVGADEVVDDTARRRPLGEGAAGAELDVVGMGADGERRRRDGAVDRGRPVRRRHRRLARIVRSHAGRIDQRAGWARSSGLSTSIASRGSPRTSTRRPVASDAVR